MSKVVFLIDGFNLYHSILSLKRKAGYSAKWLNVHSLCQSYLHLFGKQASLEKVYYFSAIPRYLKPFKPDKIERHQMYMDVLDFTGVDIVLGRFKSKDVYCHQCKSMILKHEEKETDVAIAVKLFEVCFKSKADIIIIVTGDTDLSPAVKTCKELFPKKRILFAFPFDRKNKELLKLAPDSFSISKKQYINHVLSNPIKIKNQEICKPDKW